MIVRRWTARAPESNAEAYPRHFTGQVVPHLKTMDGFVSAVLLTRSAPPHVEFEVLTTWQSMDAIRKFAGPSPEKAVVEADAREGLSDFDSVVTHSELRYSTAGV